jgi:hypothetical protein
MAYIASNIEEGKMRLGLQECMQHGLLTVLPVEHVKRGHVAAQFSFTATVQPDVTYKITNADVPLPFVHSKWNLPADLAQFVTSPMASNVRVVKPARDVVLSADLVDEDTMDQD